MKRKRLWSITPVEVILSLTLLISVCALAFFDLRVFYVALAVAMVVIGSAFWYLRRKKKDIRRYLERAAGQLNASDRDALAAFPLPLLLASQNGEILWYNTAFEGEVLEGREAYGDVLTTLTGGMTAEELSKKIATTIALGRRCYTVYASVLPTSDTTLYALYYVDTTRLRDIAEEYTLSRPVVMMIYIDNIEELMQNIRDSERAQMAGQVEILLEDWIAPTSGILRKYGSDRFLVIVEQRHMRTMLEARFPILDRVRTVQTSEHISVTLSIGVGQGKDLRESESMARQAIEMALGRGGDQAAVKTPNGFDFYGGMSKGVERRTKVRTRVVASALQELVDGSDTVLVMGHRFSDLDCLGAASALAAMVRRSGKTAYVVVHRSSTLARELIDRFEAAGQGDLFMEPEEAMLLVTDKTLLIVTDTHNPNMLEFPPLYPAVKTVVVIDHHRKMVDFIERAVIFYHEPYASSASEMVAELAQYMGSRTVTRLEAEALLAGIMLDTRSFVMKAGVRTFEAAAWLRRQGADTVEVKRMFAGSLEMYRKKADIIAHAELYRGTAVSVYDGDGGADVRVAAAQAADELLSVKNVLASFTLFSENGSVNISARSLGDFNVQLVMEACGGGGHLTMAGSLLRNTPMEEAKRRLLAAIDAQLEARERSLAAQQDKGRSRA